jgi:hypothetical protein
MVINNEYGTQVLYFLEPFFLRRKLGFLKSSRKVGDKKHNTADTIFTKYCGSAILSDLMYFFDADQPTGYFDMVR